MMVSAALAHTGRVVFMAENLLSATSNPPASFTGSLSA
jgi:hypothetical protein